MSTSEAVRLDLVRALELDLLWPFAADARAKVADGLTTAEEIDRVLPGLGTTNAG